MVLPWKSYKNRFRSYMERTEPDLWKSMFRDSKSDKALRQQLVLSGPFKSSTSIWKCHGVNRRKWSWKTTAIKLILNLIRRDEGSVKLFGLDNIRDEEAIKQQIGVVFDEIIFMRFLLQRILQNHAKSLSEMGRQSVSAVSQAVPAACKQNGQNLFPWNESQAVDRCGTGPPSQTAPIR